MLERKQNPYGSERGTGGAFSGFMIDIRDPKEIGEEERLQEWKKRNK